VRRRVFTRRADLERHRAKMRRFRNALITAALAVVVAVELARLHAWWMQ
jgi:hypothetical protein